MMFPAQQPASSLHVRPSDLPLRSTLGNIVAAHPDQFVDEGAAMRALADAVRVEDAITDGVLPPAAARRLRLVAWRAFTRQCGGGRMVS